MSTQQEILWAGEFGHDYIGRNRGAMIEARAIAFMARALAKAHGIGSAIEFGASLGQNLDALALLIPNLVQAAVEVNREACAALRWTESRKLWNESVSSVDLHGEQWDLAFTKGLLIHIPPEELPAVYDRLHGATRRWLMVAEYHNPTPCSVSYRGMENALWKRDFAGELLDAYSDLHLVDYGFVWRRDPFSPEDDVTWALMERR